MKRNNIMNNVPTGLFSPCSLTKCVSQNVLSSSVCGFQTFLFLCACILFSYVIYYFIPSVIFSKINDAFSIWTLTHKLHKNTWCRNPQTYPCYMHIHHTVGFSYKQTHTHTITYSPKTSTSEISGLMETHQSVTKTTAMERTQIQFSTFLSSQQWPLLLHNCWNSTYWWENLIYEPPPTTTLFLSHINLHTLPPSEAM